MHLIYLFQVFGGGWCIIVMVPKGGRC